MTTKIWILIVGIVFFSRNLNAQQDDLRKKSATENQSKPLDGLKKAGPGDIDPNIPMMLDPMSTPMYFEDLSVLNQNDFLNVMMSGDYLPEPYVDSAKVVRAFILRKATEEEKKRMREAQANMTDNLKVEDKMLGKPATPFSATDITGTNYSLESLKGKVIVLNFWFIECKPCVMEIPELNKLVAKYSEKDVVFLGFATNDKLKIENFLKSKPFNYNVIANSGAIVNAYNIHSFPTHIIIDKNSIVSYLTVGLGPNTLKEIEQTIEFLIK
jgi:thiol-disulfide isomerase/thioredoxin